MERKSRAPDGVPLSDLFAKLAASDDPGSSEVYAKLVNALEGKSTWNFSDMFYWSSDAARRKVLAMVFTLAMKSVSLESLVLRRNRIDKDCLGAALARPDSSSGDSWKMLKLKTLDLSNNPVLASANSKQGVVGLLEKAIRAGSWSSILNLRLSGRLKDNCSYCRDISTVANFIKHMPKLRALQLENARADAVDMDTLVKNLRRGHAPHLEELRLSTCLWDNSPDNSSFAALAKALKSGKLPHQFKVLGFTGRGSDAASEALHKDLADAMAGGYLVTLEVLDLQRCGLGLTGCQAYSLALNSANLPSLRVLNFGGNWIESIGADLLVGAIRLGGLEVLTELDLSQSRLGDDGLAVLLNVLHCKNDPKLRKLILRDAKLGFLSFERIASAVREGRLKSLEVLDLSGNRPSDEGCLSFVASFQSGHFMQVRKLYLQNTNLTDEGLSGIAHAIILGQLKAMEVLDVSQNATFGRKGLTSLAAALEFGQLRELNLCRTNAGQQFLVEIEKHLLSGKCQSLRLLDVRGTFCLSGVAADPKVEVLFTPKDSNFRFGGILKLPSSSSSSSSIFSSSNNSKSSKSTVNSSSSSSSGDKRSRSFRSASGDEWKMPAFEDCRAWVDHDFYQYEEPDIYEEKVLSCISYRNSSPLSLFQDHEQRLSVSMPTSDQTYTQTSRPRFHALDSSDEEHLGSSEENVGLVADEIYTLELEDMEVCLPNQSCQLRKDVQELGWRSFEEEFDPSRILCLYAIRADSKAVEMSFFHVEGMATLVGIGVPFSTIIVDPKQKNTITIEEGVETTWRKLWMDHTGSFFPLTFQKQEKISKTNCMSCTMESSVSLDLSAMEAATKFGVGMEESNHFIRQSTNDADGFNRRSLQTDWIYLLDKLVDHRERLLQFRHEGIISGGCTSYGVSANETSQSRSEAEGSFQKKDKARQAAGTCTINKCNTGNGSSQDPSHVAGSAVQVKEYLDTDNEEQKFLVIHVKMSERHCKLFNLVGREKIYGEDPVLNRSFIKPCMTIEFLCQQVANMEDEFVKKVNVTLNVDYQFSGNVQDQGKFGWYQNEFCVSFGCEEFDAAILDAYEVVSPLINVDVESTINNEESATLSNGSGCDFGAMGGLRPFGQVGMKRNTTRGLLHGSNQSKQTVESMQKRCLKDAPEFTMSNKCTGSEMEYKMALRSQCRPDFAPYKMWDVQTRHDYESTGMFCTVGVCVKGTWQLVGEEHRYHKFGAEKELRHYEQIRNISQAENSAVNNSWKLWTSTPSMDISSNSLSATPRLPSTEHIEEILRQKIEKRFLFNHSFSHIDLEARKRVTPYTWVLTAGVGKESPIRFLVE